MEQSVNKKNRLRFAHIFLVAAFLIVLINFVIELYEIDFWLFVFMTAASLLIPLVVFLITGRNRRIGFKKQ
jgi:hypothetical protein